MVVHCPPHSPAFSCLTDGQMWHGGALRQVATPRHQQPLPTWQLQGQRQKRGWICNFLVSLIYFNFFVPRPGQNNDIWWKHHRETCNLSDSWPRVSILWIYVFTFKAVGLATGSSDGFSVTGLGLKQRFINQMRWQYWKSVQAYQVNYYPKVALSCCLRKAATIFCINMQMVTCKSFLTYLWPFKTVLGHVPFGFLTKRNQLPTQRVFTHHRNL